MTRDDIIRLAEEAGVPMERGIINGITYCRFHPAIERFANFVAAAERETFVKDTRDEEIALLREEIKRLRFCIPEGDAAAAMEYLAYCVEKDVAKEQERCMEIVERELEAALGYVAVPLGNKITAAIRARGA